MNQHNSKITIHMVASVDGFIARKDGDVSWMHSTDYYEKGITLTEEYINEFLGAIDCYIMGATTYKHAMTLGWPYGNKPVFVFSNGKLYALGNHVTFLSGDLTQLVTERIIPHYKNIWMVGGASLTKDFIRLGLATDINITIVPVILGEGTLFFDYVGKEQLLHLKDVTSFNDGMVELWYEIVKK